MGQHGLSVSVYLTHNLIVSRSCRSHTYYIPGEGNQPYKCAIWVQLHWNTALLVFYSYTVATRTGWNSNQFFLRLFITQSVRFLQFH